MSKAMDCRWVEELIRALPLAEHAGATRDAIERHVQDCAGCRALVTAEQQLAAALRQLAAPIAAPPNAGIVMATIVQHERAGATPLRERAGAMPSRELGRTSDAGTGQRLWWAAAGAGLAFGVYLHAALTGRFGLAPVATSDAALIASSLGPLGSSPATVIVAVGLGLFLVGLLGTRDTD